jgi:hypothetical protein
MAFTYTWEVTGLRTRDEVNKDGSTLTDAVVQTYWKVTGTDEAGNSAAFNGATPFTAKDVPEGEFVVFSELTENVVLSWIKAVVEGDEQYKKHIDWRIQTEIDSTKIKDKQMPWAPDDVTPRAPLINAVPEAANTAVLPE